MKIPLRYAARLTLAALLVTAGITAAHGAQNTIALQSFQFPEDDACVVEFEPTQYGPQAELKARVEYKNGQASILVGFNKMKPAILFGGDVTSYVLWAVRPDGEYENLGELIVRRDDDDLLRYSTRLKEFGLMVTAEAYSLVQHPSALVVFSSASSPDEDALATMMSFSGLVDAPRHQLDSIANVSWDSKFPIDLLQARKAHELATESGATAYVAHTMEQATTALEEAEALHQKGKDGDRFIEAARRALTYSTQALNLTRQKQEAEAIRAAMLKRQAEMAALERRAEIAQRDLEQAENKLALTHRQLEEARLAEERLSRTASDLRDKKAVLEQKVGRMSDRSQELEQKTEMLETRAGTLEGRLGSALSEIAETRESVRGLIVSLPDILFELEQASLKPDASLTLSKLAGVLLVMPEVSIEVEGHTDSTGDDDYNDKLSLARAKAVADFLESHGVSGTRVETRAFGEKQPIADNSTADGRRQNRRVEIVFSADSTLAASR